MPMTLDEIVKLCFNEIAENSQLISVSIVVKDGNSGEIRVYNSDEYGISKYNENQI